MTPPTLAMKTRTARMPPTMAPVWGSGTMSLFSSAVDERHRKEQRDRGFISSSFNVHVVLMSVSLCVFQLKSMLEETAACVYVIEPSFIINRGRAKRVKQTTNKQQTDKTNTLMGVNRAVVMNPRRKRDVKAGDRESSCCSEVTPKLRTLVVE